MKGTLRAGTSASKDLSAEIKDHLSWHLIGKAARKAPGEVPLLSYLVRFGAGPTVLTHRHSIKSKSGHVGRSRFQKARLSAHYFVLLLFVLAALLVLDGFAAGLTLSWLVTFLTPSVSLATRSASLLASGVSIVPRKVTSLLTTSTLIFRSGVCESPMSLATILVWIQASSRVSPIVSLLCFARARSSRACSSVYFGVAVGVASALGAVMLVLAFPLARSFEFVAVPLQAATLRVNAVNAVNSNSLVLIILPFCSQ